MGVDFLVDQPEGSSEVDLEEKIFFYSNLPELRERTDISGLVGDRLDRRDSLKQTVKKMAKKLCDVPVLAGLFSPLAVFNILGYDPSTGMLPNNFTSAEGSLILLGSYSAGVLGASLINQYARNRRAVLKPEPRKRHNLAERIKLGVYNNPHLGGAVSFFAMPASLDFLNETLWHNPEVADAGLAATGIIGYLAGYYLVELARNNEFVRRGFDERRRRNFSEGNERNLLEKIYDYPLEHPGFAAAIAGAGLPAYVAGMAITNGIDPSTALSFPLKAGIVFYSALFAAAAYLGMSAISWFFHSDSLRLMGNSAMQGINSLAGRVDEAIVNQKRIMEIPTTPANERKNRFRLGDLYLRKGSIEDALSEYYPAVQLAGKSGQAYSNPIDAIGNILDSINPLNLLKGISVKENIETDLDLLIESSDLCIKYYPEEYNRRIPKMVQRVYFKKKDTFDRSAQARLKRFARLVRIGDFNDADRTMRLVVGSEPDNPEYHLLYARFLDTVGDRDFAGEEYRTAIRMLVENPGIAGNFERIGVSRNEVLTYNADKFIKRTLVFKRSEKRDEIEQEYENLRYFHERLGERVAKPLARVDDSRWSYLIMEHSGEKTLHDLAEEGKLTYDTLSEAVELLCEIQQVGEEQIRGEGNGA